MALEPEPAVLQVRFNMSVLDPELADGLHNSRSGHGSRLGSSAGLAGGSSSDLPSRAGSSASLAAGSTAGGSSGDLLGGESALGHSRGRDSSAGGGAAGTAVTDPFAASAEAPFVHAGDLQSAASQSGARTGRPAASSMQADAGDTSGAASAAESGAASNPPNLPVEATAPGMASASAPQADGQSPQRQLSRCLSDDSDVEEDRQRLRAAQWQAAEASSALQRPANPQAAGASTDTTVANHDEPSVSSSMPDGSGDHTSAAAAAQMQQRDAGHFEVAAPLSGDAKPQQHPLQQAFRAAQAQLQKPRRVRLLTVVVAADPSCLPSAQSVLSL